MPQLSWGRLRWIPVLPLKVHVCPYIFLQEFAGRGKKWISSLWLHSFSNTKAFEWLSISYWWHPFLPCSSSYLNCRRTFLESILCFNICKSGLQKRNGWLKGSDLKTIKYAAGVSEKLKGLLWNFSLFLALLKKHILITIKCVCSH